MLPNLNQTLTLIVAVSITLTLSPNLTLTQMLDAILMPERMEPVAREYLQPRLVARMWPPEVASKPFVDFLKAQYDHTQLQAIEARGSLSASG